MNYKYRDWLFWYAFFVVPFNILTWLSPTISSYTPTVYFWGWMTYFTVVLVAIYGLWYRASELLASRDTHEKRSQEKT